MISLVDITFYANSEYKDTHALVKSQSVVLAYLDILKQNMNVEVVKHIANPQTQIYELPGFRFFRTGNGFFTIPFTTLRYLKKRAPDMILVQGMGFPWQIIMMRLFVGKRSKILVQHHGETPFSGVKKFFQKWADKFISAYLFTSLGNTKKWIEAGIIPEKKNCFEVLEAASFFERKDKELSRVKCNISGNYNFIWIGRLNENKNPKMVLNAFISYLLINAEAKLYMIYQSDELLGEIERALENAGLSGKSVFLIGKVDHNELPFWLSAVEYYLSGSYREGSGYALLEAMSCGCIPIVTDIPSFKKITEDGKYGYLYEAGNEENLLTVLKKMNSNNLQIMSDSIVHYAKTHLSFESIATEITKIAQKLLVK